MKKIIALVLSVLMVLGLTAAMAEAPASTPMPETGNKTKKNGSLMIDYSHMDKGYVMVKAAKGKKKLKVQVKAGDTTLTYDLNNSGKYEVFPLQYGSGKYTFTLWRNRSGKTYEENGKITLTAKMPDELTAFLYPNQYVDYNEKTDAVVEAGKLCANLKDQNWKENYAKYQPQNSKCEEREESIWDDPERFEDALEAWEDSWVDGPQH